MGLVLPVCVRGAAMTSLDILFWLLVVLMGGIAWAVEAGLGQRYRSVLASSMFAALGSGLFMMFFIDDATTLEFAKIEKKKGNNSGEEKVEERGQLDIDNNGGNKKRRVTAKDGEGGGGGKTTTEVTDASKGDKARENPDEGTPGQAGEHGLAEAEETALEYSRDPFRDCPQCPDVVIVSPGRSVVGSLPGEVGRTEDELSQTEISMAKPYALGRIEVTRAEFTAFARESKYVSPTQCDLGRRRGRFDWMKPGIEQDDRHPAVCLSIADVHAYLDWLGEKTGRTYRLPTEAEWEKAARAGKNTPYWLGEQINRYQANLDRARDSTMAGGLMGTNPYGYADVAGNAAELTDTCAPEPTSAGQAAPPAQPVCRRVVKGGSWAGTAAMARHGARAYLTDGAALNTVGFRVLRPVDERDSHMILTEAQKKHLAKIEREAAAAAAKAVEDAEQAKRDAREAALKSAEAAKAAKLKAAKDAAAKAAQPKDAKKK